MGAHNAWPSTLWSLDPWHAKVGIRGNPWESSTHHALILSNLAKEIIHWFRNAQKMFLDFPAMLNYQIVHWADWALAEKRQVGEYRPHDREFCEAGYGLMMYWGIGVRFLSNENDRLIRFDVTHQANEVHPANFVSPFHLLRKYLSDFGSKPTAV